MVFDLGSRWKPRDVKVLTDLGFDPRQVYTIEWRDTTAFSLSLYASNGSSFHDAPGRVTVALNAFGALFEADKAPAVASGGLTKHYFEGVDGKVLRLKTVRHELRA